MKLNLDSKRSTISFLFDPRVYTAEAPYGASLVFSDRTYVFIEKKGPLRKISLRSKAPLQDAELESLAGEFHNELLNQTLRWMVGKNNKKTKDAILTRALYSARAFPAAK